jgi:F-type H+-transporting ATPase subunit b
MLIAYCLSLITLASESGGNLVEVDPGVVIWTFITFVLLLLILKKYAWKPILSAIDQRESAIKESLEKAEKVQEEAKKTLEENKEKLAQAEEEARKIIEQSRDYAEKLKTQLISDSKEQARKIVEDAKVEIEREKEVAFNSLKSQIVDITVKAAEKILKENIDKRKNDDIVKTYIDNIIKN